MPGPQAGQLAGQPAGVLLPVPYFHVVFTLPDTLYPLMLTNQKVLYDLLFRSIAERALSGRRYEVAGWPTRLDGHPAHLGPEPLVPSPPALCRHRRRTIPRWTTLAIHTAGLLLAGQGAGSVVPGLAGLAALHKAGGLVLRGRLADLSEPRTFQRWLTPLYRRHWVVYAKAPFGGAEQVFRYLGRYSHRVAIANSRLVALTASEVLFQWKDYADDNNRLSSWVLDAEEFIRRFCCMCCPRVTPWHSTLRSLGRRQCADQAGPLSRVAREKRRPPRRHAKPSYALGWTGSWSAVARIRVSVPIAKDHAAVFWRIGQTSP